MNCLRNALLLSICIGFCTSLSAQVITYGDVDVLGTGTYSVDPTADATLTGLAPGVITVGGPEVGHGFPFSPEVDDFPGTDQIYTSSAQTTTGDGYSAFAGRLAGPQVITLDYASLVPAGRIVDTLTLGIAADDFQFPRFGQPFTASINGTANTALATQLNALDQTGPQVQFFTIGIDVGTLLPSHTLTLSIDQAGDGRDGWAIDFLTVGVTTVPEPSSLLLLTILGVCGLRRARR